MPALSHVTWHWCMKRLPVDLVGSRCLQDERSMQAPEQPSKCRYYADAGRLAALLARVAAQMERGSRAHILVAGRVWDRARPALVADLDLAVALNEAFHVQFKCDAHAACMALRCPAACVQVDGQCACVFKCSVMPPATFAFGGF